MPNKEALHELESGSTDLVVSSLAVEREPEQVLAEAQKAAAALKRVLDSKPDKVTMNGQQYLEFEDWQTLARFYGVTAREDGDPEPVVFGEAQGFKASAVALREGCVISRATAYCLSDEPKWSTRTKYEWAYCLKAGGHSVDDPGRDNMVWIANPAKPGRMMPKKERITTGQENVPLFQLASMAQTRACAKALRNVLSWVVVLAGYKATPAEELEAQTKQEPNGHAQAEPGVEPEPTTDPNLGSTHPGTVVRKPAAESSDSKPEPACNRISGRVLGVETLASGIVKLVFADYAVFVQNRTLTPVAQKLLGKVTDLEVAPILVENKPVLTVKNILKWEDAT